TTITSAALPASFSLTASSTAISSNGFTDILTLASSTPVPSVLTRTLTLKSTTLLIGTRIFMGNSLVFGCQEGEGEHGQRQSLQDNTGLHQFVAIFFVELASLDHRDDPDNQNPQNGGHGDKHANGEKQVHP